MLELLRKYQKALFIVVTAMVVASFVFFGTFSTFMNEPSRGEDRVIGHAIDGSEMHLFEMQSLARFLALEGEVLKNDLLRTQVAEEIVRRSFPLLKAALEQKLQRAKSYRGYEHPQAPFLSAKAVWEQAAPMINREWSALQVAEEATPEVFVHLAHLYQLQSALPSDLLRRILVTQEQRFNWLKPDPRLRQEDLSLFGFHSATDWFGAEFVELMAEFLHNAAITAEKKGIVVTLDEARSDFRASHSKDAPRSMGLSESEAVDVWRKVLLFRRSFHELGKSAFLDRLSYTEFMTVAAEEALIELYRWGEALPVHNAVDALALDTYMKAVLPKGDLATPPAALLSLAEIQERAPSLIATRYTAKVSAVDKREAALRAPLKELWDFETKDKTWGLLAKEFPTLRNVPSKTAEERFQALEKLETSVRTSVDLFARRLLIEEHTEWMRSALDAAKAEEKQLVLSAGEIELAHLTEPKRLAQLFEQILTAPEAALGELHCFVTKDAVFRFENITKVSGPAVKTFAEARTDGSLTKLVDAKLEKERAKNPKPLDEVREELAQSLLKKQRLSAEPLAIFAKKAKENLAAWTRTASDEPLLAQFKLERVEQKVARTAPDEWVALEAFTLAPQTWSSVHAPSGSFFFLKERHGSDESVQGPLSLGQDIVSADVQRTIAKQLIDTMFEKKAVVIPLQKE